MSQTPDSTPPANKLPLDPTKLTPEQAQAIWKTASTALWKRGELKFLFHDTQVKIWEAYQACKSRKFFLLCSRRLGKSFMLFALAFGTAIKKPNARVLFLAPTGKQALKIISDTGSQVLESCPADLKPHFDKQAKEYTFKNGSIVRVAGLNNENYSDLRGGTSDLVIIDECAEVDNLKFVVDSIAMPTLMTTRGRLILATTPAASPAHDSAKMYETLAGIEATARFELRDAPHVDRETKIEYLMEAGETREDAEAYLNGDDAALKTTTAQREYAVQFVTDASKAVLPGFFRAKKNIVREWPRPEKFDPYISIDPGFEDKTAIIAGYWDFLNAKLVIEGERLIHRGDTLTIVKELKELEVELGYFEPTRYIDPDARLAADLRRMHGIHVQNAIKKNALVGVNMINNDIAQGALIIHPNCKHLIRQCEGAVWNNQASDFARLGKIGDPENELGHFDSVAALKYLTRMVNRTRSPYPAHYYEVGGKLGLPKGTWVSPKNQKPRSLGLHSDTPLGRKLARVKKR